MKPKIDWIIHLCKNGVCEECGEEENGYLPAFCNAHTHGLEKYGVMDFQLVLDIGENWIGHILNSLALRASKGELFINGQLVKDIFEDCPVQLEQFEESGRQVLRVIIPDAENRFPDDPNCSMPYKLQSLKTDELNWKSW